VGAVEWFHMEKEFEILLWDSIQILMVYDCCFLVWMWLTLWVWVLAFILTMPWTWIWRLNVVGVTLCPKLNFWRATFFKQKMVISAVLAGAQSYFPKMFTLMCLASGTHVLAIAYQIVAIISSLWFTETEGGLALTWLQMQGVICHDECQVCGQVK
jgi:hypothetical protein